MHVGWVGLGRLGLPCATAMASRGLDVCGYDPAPQTVETLPYEAGLADLDSAVDVVDLPTLVRRSDIVMVAVQTPHVPEHDGTHRMTDERADFEVGYLRQAVRSVCREAERQRKTVVMAVVSTVLPGTWSRVIEPQLNQYVRAAYTPSLIAMGTTVADWLAPEMVILGADDELAASALTGMHRKMHDRPVVRMRPVEAELTKMSYNAFIGLKIAYANWLMEVCHHTGADVDAVTGALAQASDRIISSRYLSAGMGDGGGCHPRDNLALSWLSRRFDVSVDVPGFAMQAREAQTEWLADMARHWSQLTGLPIVLAGVEYKANVPLTAGSPALLLQEMLGGARVVTSLPPDDPAVYVITTRHDRWPLTTWPAGSVVLDPWGYIPDQDGVTVVRIGRV